MKQIFIAVLLPLLLCASPSVEEMFVNYNQEPTIEEVLQKAFEYFDPQLKNLKTMRKRVRRAAWLPHFRSGFGRDHDTGISIRDTPGVTRVNLNRNYANWTFDFKAEWELDKLIFRKEELDVEDWSKKLSTEAQALRESVIKAYFDRRKDQIWLHLKGDRATEIQKLEHFSRIKERGAYLNAVTNGIFQKSP